MGLDTGYLGKESRLRALDAAGILDTPYEADFDDLARLAAQICETPIAVICLLDRDRAWAKAHLGLDRREVPLERSLCATTAAGDAMVHIRDLNEDPRTATCTAVVEDGLRFYASAPLVEPNNHVIGCLCVMDRHPREMDGGQLFALRVLARQAVGQIEMRRANRAHVEALGLAEAHADELERALDVEHTLKLEIDHRVKNSLQLVGSLLQMQAGRAEVPDVRDALMTARSRVTAISTIHGALNRSASLDRVALSVYLAKLVEELRAAARDGVSIVIETDEASLRTTQASSLAILVNEFVTNSLKYAFPDGRPGTVRLVLRSDGQRVTARFSDDGIGLPKGPMREGLGTRIMHAVGLQLGAEIEIGGDAGGTTLAFSFPLDV